MALCNILFLERIIILYQFYGSCAVRFCCWFVKSHGDVCVGVLWRIIQLECLVIKSTWQNLMVLSWVSYLSLLGPFTQNKCVAKMIVISGTLKSDTTCIHLNLRMSWLHFFVLRGQRLRWFSIVISWVPCLWRQNQRIWYKCLLEHKDDLLQFLQRSRLLWTIKLFLFITTKSICSLCHSITLTALIVLILCATGLKNPCFRLKSFFVPNSDLK